MGTLVDDIKEGTVNRASCPISVFVNGHWVRLRWWANGKRLSKHTDLSSDEAAARSYYLQDNALRRKEKKNA